MGKVITAAGTGKSCMQVDHNVLIAYGGVARKLGKGSIIFHEGSTPHFFYQLIDGEVKLFSANAEGKELTQGLFGPGESFGEPPLLLDKPYPSTAQAVTASAIVKLSREKFLALLADYPELSRQMMYTFARRLYQKAISVQVWVNQTPEQKITHFLKNAKVNATDSCGLYHVPYTRQQIADFIGLRVETVIRTLVRMSREGKITIDNHKLYY